MYISLVALLGLAAVLYRLCHGSYSKLKSFLNMEFAAIDDPTRTYLLLQQYYRAFARYWCIILVIEAVIFASISSTYGTHDEQYIWMFAAIFKGGVVPSLLFILLWTFLLLSVWTAIHLKASKLHYSPHSDVSISYVGNTEGGVHQSHPNTYILQYSHRVVCAVMLLRLVFLMLFNGFVIIGLNVFYVNIEAASDNNIKVMAMFGFGIIKQVWNWSALPWLLASPMLPYNLPKSEISGHGLSVLKFDTVFISLLVTLNNIIIPAISLIVLNPNCFNAAFYVAKSINFVYTSFQCSFDSYTIPILNAEGTAVSELLHSYRQACTTQITNPVIFTPSFSYNYQCSASLIQYYAPVFAIIQLAGGFVQPLLLWLSAHILKKYPLWAPYLSWLMPKILLADDEKANKTSYSLIDTNREFLLILQDLTLLLTYGTVAPLLGILIVFSMASKHIQKVYLLHHIQSSASLDGFVRDCWEFAMRVPKYGAVMKWYLVSFSSVFYAPFLLDMAGTSRGWRDSLWAPLLMVVLPTSICLIFTMIERVCYKSQSPTHLSPSQLQNDPRRSSHRLVISPLSRHSLSRGTSISVQLRPRENPLRLSEVMPGIHRITISFPTHQESHRTASSHQEMHQPIHPDHNLHASSALKSRHDDRHQEGKRYQNKPLSVPNAQDYEGDDRTGTSKL